MFLVLFSVGSLSLLISLSFSDFFIFLFFFTDLGSYILRSVIPAILDFHFSLLHCSNDVDDNDGCMTEKEKGVGTAESNLCAKLGLVCVWVCSHHVGLWFVYEFLATMDHQIWVWVWSSLSVAGWVLWQWVSHS